MKSNYQTGHDAEKLVATHLERALGFKIRELNWKTRYCEIDIVAEKDSCLYFIEVKSRKSHRYGDGFDYITPRKQKQMQFAAEMWLQQHEWVGEISLSAASVVGDDVSFIDTI